MLGLLTIAWIISIIVFIQVRTLLALGIAVIFNVIFLIYGIITGVFRK